MFEGVGKSVVVVSFGGKAEVAVDDRRLCPGEDDRQPGQV